MTSCGLWPFPQNLGRKVYTGSATFLRLHSARSSSWDKRHLGEMTLSSAGCQRATGNRAVRKERSRGWWGWGRVRVPLWVGFMGSAPLEASGNNIRQSRPKRGQKDERLIQYFPSEIGCDSLLGTSTTTRPACIPPCPNQLCSSD